jgi:prepilin-type N-terminal cleavage/methylation domain-containing protein
LKKRKKLFLSIPYGVTLVEVIISLLVISVISIISYRVVSQMGLVFEKISEEEIRQRSISNSLRLLEEDFNSINFFKKKDFINNFIFDNKQLILPNGVKWELNNGSLKRFGKLNSSTIKELILLKNVSSFELGIWLENKFHNYFKKNKVIFFKNRDVGIEIKITQYDKQPIRKIIILRGLR